MTDIDNTVMQENSVTSDPRTGTRKLLFTIDDDVSFGDVGGDTIILVCCGREIWLLGNYALLKFITIIIVVVVNNNIVIDVDVNNYDHFGQANVTNGARKAM